MNISIITPIYNGNKYLNEYLISISKACKHVKDIEVIWVNDSPEIEIKYDKSLIQNFELRITENSQNEGIHKSRIVGLNMARGEYILFLDQDDFILEDALITHYNLIKDGADMTLGNGFNEYKGKRIKIYKNKFSQRFAIKKRANILARCFIISPGQCLIRRTSIPDDWSKKIVRSNGTDDYLLWLLMFNKKTKMICNYNTVYIHTDTGENFSLNKEKMFKSQQEIIDILKNNDEYDKNDLKKLERAIIYKHNYKQRFIKETLKNIDIFIYNVYYKIVWKGMRSKD